MKGLNDEQSQAVDLAGLELSDSFTFQPHSHWSDDPVSWTGFGIKLSVL